MAAQTKGKGKKKNKEVMKVSLDELNQIATPHGHSVVSVKMTGLDWAETMAVHDHQSAETQQIIVPTAPRAQRGPNVDPDSLPNEPPFRVSLFNLPMSVEDTDIIERFFNGLDVLHVDIQKSTTTVELASKDHLYDALCKDGTQMKNRTVNVCLYGHSPRSEYGSDRYGARGDRYGDRYQSGGQRMGGFGSGGFDRAGGFDRQGGYERQSGFGRPGGYERPGGFGDRDRGFDRDSFQRGQGAGGGGFGQPRFGRDGRPYSGAGEAPEEEPDNWRARPTPSHTHNNGPTRQPAESIPYLPQQPRPSATSEVRQRLVLTKRTTPIQGTSEDAPRNEAIFGKAKPSSTPYEKMKEIEEKLSGVQIKELKPSTEPNGQADQPGQHSEPKEQLEQHVEEATSTSPQPAQSS